MKTNKALLFSAFFIVPVLYIDKSVALWFDTSVRHWVDRYVYDVVHVLNAVISFVSNGGTLIAGAIGLILFAGPLNTKLRAAGRSLLIGLAAGGILVQVLKHLLGRARPRVTFDPVFIGPSFRDGYDSFPSGHTTLVFCFAYILSRYYPRYRAGWYLFAVIAAIDRLDCLSHFPADVIAGAIFGTLVAKIVMARTATPSEDRTEIPQTSAF